MQVFGAFFVGRWAESSPDRVSHLEEVAQGAILLSLYTYRAQAPRLVWEGHLKPTPEFSYGFPHVWLRHKRHFAVRWFTGDFFASAGDEAPSA